VATTGYTKNFVVKNGLTTGPIELDGLTGIISGTDVNLTGNLSVTGNSNLGSITHLYISGGSSGQAIVTDGAGNLSFANASASSSPAPMPTYVASGDVLTIAANYQGLFGYPITVDGSLVVDGIMVDVNDATVPSGNTGCIQYANGNVMGSSADFTFISSTNTLSVPNITTTGVVKTTATTYSGLPTASSAGAGARAFITNGNTTTFLAIVGGGGSNAVPVVSNGTNWIVG